MKRENPYVISEFTNPSVKLTEIRAMLPRLGDLQRLLNLNDSMLPIRSVRTSMVELAYTEHGPSTGMPILLLHGFPYSPHAYDDVIPPLVAQGYRVIVPYLRGFGPTRFLSPATTRIGQQAALARDLVDLLDALFIPRAALVGYDWGGR